MTNPPPIAAALQLALAVDALRLAGGALNATAAALAEIEPEDQGPIDSDDVAGLQETCRLFIALFGSAGDALGPRSPHPMMLAIRDCIQAREDAPGKTPGLARAEAAISFAEASMRAAVDALDVDDEWHGPCVAARTVLLMVELVIDGALVRRGPMEREFFLSN